LLGAGTPGTEKGQQAADRTTDPASARDLLNAMIQTTLPVLKRGVELLLIEQNRSGGLPLFTELRDQSPVYRLRILKQDGGELRPGDIVKKLDVRVCDVEACRTCDVTDDELSRMPAEVRKIAKEVLMLDLEVDVDLDFREEGSDASKIDFQVHGERWWSPTLGSVSIDTLHAHAKVRVWWSLNMQKLFLAFHEEPQIKWDIEASLLSLGIQLPDSIEDSFVAWSLRKVLAWFDLDHPLELPQQDPLEAPPQELVQAVKLGREGAESGCSTEGTGACGIGI